MMAGQSAGHNDEAYLGRSGDVQLSHSPRRRAKHGPHRRIKGEGDDGSERQTGTRGGVRCVPLLGRYGGEKFMKRK